MRQEMWEHNYGDTLSRTPLLVSSVPDCLMSCRHFLGRQQHCRMVHWGEIGRQLYPPAAVCSGALSLGVHGWVLNRRLCGGQGGVGQGTLLGCAH